MLWCVYMEQHTTQNATYNIKRWHFELTHNANNGNGCWFSLVLAHSIKKKGSISVGDYECLCVYGSFKPLSLDY